MHYLPKGNNFIPSEMLQRSHLQQLPQKPKFSLAKHRLLIGLFAAALTSSIVFTPAVYPQSPSPSPFAREELIAEIHEYAARHVENEQSLQTAAVVNIFSANKAGMTRGEIGKIYEEEYTKLKKKQDADLWHKIQNDLFKNLGWVSAAILGFLLIFRDVVTGWVTNLLNTIVTWIYNRCAGRKFFWSISLKHYRQGLIKKHNQLKMTFRTERPLSLRDIFVPLKVTGTNDSELIDAYRAIANNRRLMVTGAPGSGKSLLLRHLALRYALKEFPEFPEQPIPVLLELHRLSNSNKSLQDWFVDALARDDFPHAEKFVDHSLESNNLLLLFDGLDEVNSGERHRIVRQIKDLLDKHPKCRAIITCRTAVYRGEFNDVVDKTLEIVDFSDQQIQQFLTSWEKEMQEGKSVEQLMQTLHDKPKIMAIARNPLILTIIAYLYTDTPFILPHSRAEFYQKSTDILLDTWRREHNQFQAREKNLVMQHLALFLQDSAKPRQQDKLIIDYQTLLAEVKKVLPGLSIEEEKAVPLVDEIEKRSGLLLKVDRLGEKYHFAHLTLQEFFAAAALREKADGLITRFQNDPDAWRETVKLWCGLAGDSSDLISKVYETDAITAFECLADAPKVDPDLAKRIIDHFKIQLGAASGDNAIAKAFGNVAANTSPRGSAVFQFLEDTLATSSEEARRIAAVNALSFTNRPKAAQALFKEYSQPEIRKALLRMGDVAVSLLADLVASGSEDALDALLAIGTANAARAILPLLWQTQTNVSYQAAWRLAVLLQQPSIEVVLRNYSLTEEQRRGEWLDWIWKPFDEPTDSALPIIAGRIAYLISKSPDEAIPKKQLQIDSRLVIPLCSIELVGSTDFLTMKQYKPGGKSIKGVKVFQYLLSSLESRNKLHLTHVIRASSKQVTKNHWVNIFKPIKYEFDKSWHHAVIRLIYKIIYIILIFICIYAISFPFMLLILLPLIIISFLFSLFFINKQYESFAWIILSLMLIYSSLFVTFFSPLSLMKIFSDLQGLLLIGSILVVTCILLWIIGKRRERKAENPLANILYQIRYK
ncbi:MAG: NACHT domain-containing protein [Symploca sp. SIO3E6]|nr:NACHT domain-containing protein [Caldora sp. SIO3E6]